MTMKIEQVSQALRGAAPISLAETDYAAKGYSLEASFAPEKVVGAVSALDGEGFFLESITGVDWLTPKTAPKAAPAEAPAEAGEAAPAQEPPKDEMEVVYDFNHYDGFCRVALRVRVPRDAPGLPTISAVYPGANWHEREVYEFFGIIFEGHPDLKPLLLPEDADFHPLRKDFVS